MTSKLDVIKAYIDTAWANPPSSVLEAAATYFSDDFKSIDKDGNAVMDKQMFMGMTQLLFAAFKDFKAVYGDLREENGGVSMRYHFEGTHTGDLDLSAMGVGVIPASGKKIVWPDATSVWSVEGGKITAERSPSGGMESFLEPLGVKLPAA